jgi:hypothetical protein
VHRAEEQLHRHVGEAPEVVGALVDRPGLVGGDVDEAARAQRAVDLARDDPGHGDVLEHGDGEDGVRRGAADDGGEAVRVAHHVHAGAGMDVEAV